MLVFMAVAMLFVLFVFMTTQTKTLSNIPFQIKTATLIYILVPGRNKERKERREGRERVRRERKARKRRKEEKKERLGSL